MKFILKIDTNNAAFEDVNELGRILKQVANDYSQMSDIIQDFNFQAMKTKLRDINGNIVGTATVLREGE
jgi:hypothetical protein